MTQHAKHRYKATPRHELMNILALYVVVRPSVCRLSVCNVRAPYSSDWNFLQCFDAIWYAAVAICWHPGKILRRSSQGNPSVGGVNYKRGSRI